MVSLMAWLCQLACCPHVGALHIQVIRCKITVNLTVAFFRHAVLMGGLSLGQVGGTRITIIFVGRKVLIKQTCGNYACCHYSNPKSL